MGHLIALTLIGGSHAGMGWSRAALHAELNGVHETEHFVIRYDASGYTAVFVEAIAEEAEWQWKLLTTAWDIETTGRVRLEVFDDRDTMGELTEGTSAHAGLGHIKMLWWNAFTDTLSHELVHALHHEMSPSWWILLSRAHLEGTAVAWADHLDSLPSAHAAMAAAARSDTLPHAEQLLSPSGFVSVPEHVAYDASGPHRLCGDEAGRWPKVFMAA